MSVIDYDDELETNISIWVATSKNMHEFKKSLARIINPVIIQNHFFNLGGIDVEIKQANTQPPKFAGIPNKEYSFELVVPTTQLLIWGCFDKQVVYALTLGLRSTFSCEYLVIANNEELIFYSGENKPFYVNLNARPFILNEIYPSFKSFKNVVELRL